MRLNDTWAMSATSVLEYTLVMSNLRTLDQLFAGEIFLRWARPMNRLYIDWGWTNSYQVAIGQVCVIECYCAIDPEKYPNVWEDRFLKEYATALIKRQWGNDMKKHKGIQLPGGVTLSGQEIFDEATIEIDKLHKEMENNYGGILSFQMN